MSDARPPGFLSSPRVRFGLALAVFLIAALFLLWEEHEAHIQGYGPLLVVLLVCGGMHFFMHGGHGGHGGHGQRDVHAGREDNSRRRDRS
jgi:hypothetical protein